MRTISHCRPGNLRLKVAALLLGLILADTAAWGWAFDHRRMPEGKEEPGGDRPLRLLHQLARNVVDGGDVIGVDRMAQAEAVRQQRGSEQQRTVAECGIFGSALVAASAFAFRAEIDAMRNIGATVSTSVSALFLLAVALMNVAILCNVHGSFRRAKAGQSAGGDDLDIYRLRGCHRLEQVRA